MSDDPTLPPRQPNTPRVLLRRAWAWLMGNPIIAAILGGLLTGSILGKIL